MPANAAYERIKQQTRERSRRLIREDQDIGEIPAVVDPARRARAIESFEFFCHTYFPLAFSLPWSPYHKKAAAKIERACTFGGMFAFGMPRGSGKTTICDWATLWAMLTGRSSYVVFVGATEKSAERRLASLKIQLEANPLLAEDFPCETYPIHCLERSVRRADGQTYKGIPTRIVWKQKRIVLPWVDHPDCLGRGGCVDVVGLTGEIRGLNYTRPDGTVVRPSLAICDDPQTRESARSATQSEERERTMAGDVAYLAGPGKPIAVIVPCTVVYEGDLADNLLNRDKHPEYQGERTAMVERFPANEKLWDQYADILQTALKNDGDTAAATDFYRQNQTAMDEGAVVSWPERFAEGELSAIQHAMNLKIRDEAAFWAECQNEPIAKQSDLILLDADAIAAKISGYRQREFPSTVSTLTAFIDVQGSLLYWAIAAWQTDFTGWIVDYGVFPKQSRKYFSLRSARATLKNRYKNHDEESAIYAGLNDLFADILGREYVRDDGASMRITRCFVDANWGKTSTTVNQCCRQSKFAATLTPSYGRGIKASHQPISQWQQTRGKRCGPEWAPTQTKGKQLVGCIYDTYYWKKRLHDALCLPLGARGSLALFDDQPQNHRMFAEHCTAEVPKLVESSGRTVYEWELKPNHDNHFFDCAVGCMVAASYAGVLSPGQTNRKPRRRIRGLIE